MYKTVDIRLPSVGIFAAPTTISYLFGIPARATYRSHQVDIKLNHSSIAAKDGNKNTSKLYVENAGMLASFLEGFVPEELFYKSLGAGSNTARLLDLANTTAVPIHHITAGNISTQLPQLAHSDEVLQDVSNAVASGLEVVIPRTALTNHSWTGSGYIMRDPVTGSGDYRISGGLSGDSQTDCALATKPVPVRYPKMSLLSTLLIAASPIFIDDDGSVAQFCTAASCGFAGIRAAVVSDCAAMNCGNYGIYSDVASNCRGTCFEAGTGVYAYSAAYNCSGWNYGSAPGYGVYSSYLATGCFGYSQGGTGLRAYIANSCYGSFVTATYKYNMP